MNLTHDEVLQILKLLDNTELDELDLQMGELKLTVRRKGAARVSPDRAVEEGGGLREGNQIR